MTHLDKSKFKDEFLNRLIRFSIEIIKFCAELRKDRNMWTVADQTQDSGTSIGANTWEAKSASSRKDYIKFFEIALKSANETIYWLLVISLTKPELREEADALLKEAQEIASILASSIITLKGKR